MTVPVRELEAIRAGADVLQKDSPKQAREAIENSLSRK